MKRLAALLALVFVAMLPVATPAKPKPSAAPGTLSPTVPTCAAGDPAVWVNTTSKIYWPQGSEYYGKTKHGGYACTSQAVAMGARAAKSGGMKKHKKGAGMSAMPAPTASP